MALITQPALFHRENVLLRHENPLVEMLVRKSLKLSYLKNRGYKKNYVLEIVPWECRIKTETELDTA